MADDPNVNEPEPGLWERESQFTGRAGELSPEEFDTYADAYAWGLSMVTGELDPFFGMAWERVQVRQGRDAFGRFSGWWEVIVDFVRPGPGDDY